MSTETESIQWDEWTETEARRPVRIGSGPQITLVHLPAHEGQPAATYRFRAGTVGQNFGTIGILEDASSGEEVCRTGPVGFGAYGAALRGAIKGVAGA